MEFEVSRLLSEIVRLAQINLPRVIIAMGVMTGGGIAIDLYADDPRTGVLLGIINFVLQYWLTAGLLQDLNRRSVDAGGIGSLFIVGLLSTLAIVVGLLLLIIPGVILAVRWSMSGPIVLSERGTATEALGKSWQATEGRFWPIFVVLLISLLPTTMGMVVLILASEQLTLMTSLAYNFCFNVGLILGWHAAIAFYLASKPKDERLEEIFA